MEADVIVVGAGPAGLCLARSLAGSGLRIAMVEQQSLDKICRPEFDGREIALTQKSVEILKTLRIWELIDPNAKSRLAGASIFNGKSPFALKIGHELTDRSELGWLVSNHLVRKAAYESVRQQQDCGAYLEVIASERVVDVGADSAGAWVKLESGKTLSARLIVAADSRFSPTRRMMGIPADMHDFGTSMLACGMHHDRPHHHTAWEWFDYGQTLALLPMNPDPESGAFRSSVVITLPGHETEQLMNLAAGAFNRQIQRRFDSRLGGMALATSRHVYPLVSVYPKRFTGRRFATVGDAAVGMHPVTAHGFNFGLTGVQALSNALVAAHASGLDIASEGLLNRYENQFRCITQPLYLLTRLITDLYTTNHSLARLARDAMLRVGEHLKPFKRAVAASLAGY